MAPTLRSLSHPSMRPPRPVPLEGAFNFRDVGGYRAERGWVRTGLVYRSDALHLLTPGDRDRLRRLRIRTVLDLRSAEECERFGVCDVSSLSASCVHIPLLEEPWTPPGATERASDWLADRYAAVLAGSADALVAVLAVLADAASWPVVFHCTGGKDRAGVVAAVLLALLGAGADDIVTDYCRSTPGITWLRHVRVGAGPADELPGALFEVPADAMRGFLERVVGRYGSIERWALDVGMPPSVQAALRAGLVDPVDGRGQVFTRR